MSEQNAKGLSVSFRMDDGIFKMSTASCSDRLSQSITPNRK